MYLFFLLSLFSFPFNSVSSSLLLPAPARAISAQPAPKSPAATNPAQLAWSAGQPVIPAAAPWFRIPPAQTPAPGPRKSSPRTPSPRELPSASQARANLGPREARDLGPKLQQQLPSPPPAQARVISATPAVANPQTKPEIPAGLLRVSGWFTRWGSRIVGAKILSRGYKMRVPQERKVVIVSMNFWLSWEPISLIFLRIFVSMLG